MTLISNKSINSKTGFSKTLLLQIKFLFFYNFAININLQVFWLCKAYCLVNLSSLQNNEAIKCYCLQQQLIEKLNVNMLNSYQTQQYELSKKQLDGHNLVIIDGSYIHSTDAIYSHNLRYLIDSVRNTTFYFPGDTFS